MAEIEPVGVGEIEAVHSDDRRNMLAEQLSAAEAAETTPETPAEKPAVERARAPDGKFAPKTETVEAAPVEQPVVVEEPAWKKPLPSWKKEMHDFYSKADPKLQEYIHQREVEMRAGIEPLRNKGQFYDTMVKTVQPFMGNIKAGAGGDSPAHVVQAVKGLMEADHILRNSPPEQKRAYYLRLAQHYGIQLGDVSQEPAISPELYQLRNELAQIRGELTSEKQAKKDAEERALLNDITKFATTHEHFERLRPTMQGLLMANQAEDLETAYTKALRLDDELFQAEQAASQAKANQEKIKTKDQAARAAKTASVSVRSSAPGTHTAPKAQDRRSRLSEQFDGLDERL